MLRNSKVFLLDQDSLSRVMIAKELASEVQYLKEITDLSMVPRKQERTILILDEKFLDEHSNGIADQLAPFNDAIKVILTDDKDDCVCNFGERCLLVERPFSSKFLYDFVGNFYSPSAGKGVDVEKLYDLSKLRTMSRGNEEFILKMVNIFCKDIPESMDKASAAMATHEYPKIKAVLHRIKPSVKMLEINSIVQLLEQTEHRAATETEVDEIPNGINKLKSTLKKVVEELGTEFNISAL